MDAILAAGYEVVLNLAMPDSTGAARGMENVYVPVVWRGSEHYRPGV